MKQEKNNQEKFTYKISIQLKGYSSVRVFQVDDETLLSQLHDVIQDAFELDHIHAYRFYRNEISLSYNYNWKGFPILPDASSVKNALAKQASLSTLHLKEGNTLTYIYHPEYNWVFYIKFLSKELFNGSHKEPEFLSYTECPPSSLQYTSSQNQLLKQLKGKYSP